MAVIDPQQEIFSAVYMALKAKGHSVYDGFLPPEGTPYPFDYMGECQQVDEQTKSQVIGTVHLTIHTWSNTPKNRGTLSAMMHDIKQACRSISHTANFAWTVRNVTQRVLPDNTTKTPLLHGVLEVEFKFS